MFRMFNEGEWSMRLSINAVTKMVEYVYPPNQSLPSLLVQLIMVKSCRNHNIDRSEVRHA